MKKQLLILAVLFTAFAAQTAQAVDILKNSNIKNDSDYILFIAWTYKALNVKYKSDYERLLPGESKDFSLRGADRIQVEVGQRVPKAQVANYRKNTDDNRVQVTKKRVNLTVDTSGNLPQVQVNQE